MDKCKQLLHGGNEAKNHQALASLANTLLQANRSLLDVSGRYKEPIINNQMSATENKPESLGREAILSMLRNNQNNYSDKAQQLNENPPCQNEPNNDDREDCGEEEL